MKKLSLFLLSAQLFSVLAFDFGDFNNPTSPAFNLEAFVDDNAGFEPKREPESALHMSGQTPADSSLFVDSLLGDLYMWQDSDNDDRDILERQIRTCPPGTYMCPNGRCCPASQTCVPGGCCPAGNSQCGSRGCYNPGAGEVCCGGAGTHCPRGYYCTSNGCCRTGTKPCGSGCYDPKTQVCCSSSSTTCPISETCVPGGCCPKGMQKCGNTKCYNPATETCCPANSGLCSRQNGVGSCALDTVCAKDMTCVDGNRCCPRGQKLCGTKGCYDPQTQVCCNDKDGYHCPKDYDCMKDGGCCPQGMIKCGKNKCYNPKTSICCQDAVGSNNWACKSGFQCCVASGGCFDVNTQRCCASGPCDRDGACCAGKCCPSGYRCDKNNKCRKRSKPRPPKTKTCTTPTPTRAAPTPMVTVPFVYDPARRLHQSADSDDVFEISNRAVLINMCRGMQNLNGGIATQQFKLTYAGTQDDECWQKRNRAIMCPEGFCRKAVEEYVAQFFPDGVPSWAIAAIEAAADMQCDEFPFANSLQGGDSINGVAICIPADDNSFQGSSLSPYFRRKDIEAGEDYMIEIVGWDCGKQEPLRRRRDVYFATDTMLDDMGLISRGGLLKRNSFDEAVVRYGDEMYHGFQPSNSRLNLMTMPLGDLAAGTYIVHLNVTKGNLSYAVVDHVGNTFEATVLSNGSVKFTLEEEWAAVSLTGTTEEEEVNLSYKAEALPGPEGTTTTNAPVPSATGNMGYLLKPKKAITIACIMATFWN